MHRLRLWLLAAFVTFSVGVMIFVLLNTRHSQVRQPSNQEVRLIIPHASWEPIFFRSIKSLTSLTAQPQLREVSSGKDEYEARVWWGFGLSPLEGISLKYSAGQWSAIHVKADHYYEPKKATYMYPNPMLEKCSEAKQVMKITEIIDEEFEWSNTDTIHHEN